MSPLVLLAWSAVALAATVVPGIDTVLVTRNTVRYGRWYGILTAVATSAGQIVHAAAAAAGLSVILLQSAALFEIIKLAGAAYLIVLGVLAWRASFREPAEPIAAPSASLGSAGRVAAGGLLTSLTNPKVALFWLSALPQFVDLRAPGAVAYALMLGAISFAVNVSWMSVYAAVIDRVSAFLKRPRVRRIQERVLGTVFVGLGLGVAADRA